MSNSNCTLESESVGDAPVKRKRGRPRKPDSKKEGAFFTKQTWQGEQKPILEANFGSVKRANASMKHYALTHKPEPGTLSPELTQMLQKLVNDNAQMGNLLAQCARTRNGYMASVREAGLLGKVPFPADRELLMVIAEGVTKIREGVDKVVEIALAEQRERELAA